MKRAAALAAVALAVTGCSSWNPLVALGLKTEPIHKPTPLAPIKESVKPVAVWTVSVGKSQGYVFRPALEGDRIYAAAGDGTIVALEEASGRVASRIETKKKLSGGLSVAGGKILASTSPFAVPARIFPPATGSAYGCSSGPRRRCS